MIIVGVNSTENKVYQRSAPGVWEEFPWQPSGGQVGYEIWATPGGAIFTHNGLSNLTTGKYLHFDPATKTWTEHANPESVAVRGLWGSDDGQHVYAGCTGSIHKWNGTAWSVVLTGAGDAQSVWCDSTGQYIWATGGVGSNTTNMWYSDDFGATWTDYYSQANADLGVWTGFPGAVFGFSADEVYLGTRKESGQGWIIKWNGSVWSQHTTLASMYLKGAGLWGTSGSNLWVVGNSQYTSIARVWHWTGSWALELDSGVSHNSVTVGRNLMGLSAIEAVVALFSGSTEYVFETLNGLNWTQAPTVMAGYINGVATWESSDPPYFSNQDPAPDSTGNRGDGPIYCEVIDDNGNLDPGTVRIYVDGELAWSGSSAAPGWSGTRVVVADGYGYTLTRTAGPLPAGATITVRGIAQDQGGLEMDESYTFDTILALDGVTPDVISTVGGESFTILGLWPVDRTVTVHLGPLGTVEDPLCYGGQGLGYEALSLDGMTLQFTTPPLAKGSVILTVVDGATTLQILAIMVVERSWPGKLHRVRASFPPWGALGRRKLGEEDQE